MTTKQNPGDLVKNRRVINLCSVESDSKWLTKNLANKVFVLEPEEISEKIKNGEVDTIFFRVSENSTESFKIMGKLLRDHDLKNIGCRVIIINNVGADSLVEYIHDKMDDLLRFLGYQKEVLAIEGENCSVYN